MFDNPSDWQKYQPTKSINNLKFKGWCWFCFNKIHTELNNNTNNNYDYEFGVETLFDKFPKIEIGLKELLVILYKYIKKF
jgi:hypothetical protein